MRSLAVLLCALMLDATAAAHADSLIDLRRPSSTIQGCINHLGLFGTGSGIAEPTCEGKAALAEWNEHAAAINAASDTLARAANSPDEATPLVIIDTFDACAAAADMIARLYRPARSPPHDNAAVLGCLPLCCTSVPITPHVRAGTGTHAIARTALASP